MTKILIILQGLEIYLRKNKEEKFVQKVILHKTLLQRTGQQITSIQNITVKDICLNICMQFENEYFSFQKLIC